MILAICRPARIFAKLRRAGHTPLSRNQQIPARAKRPRKLFVRSVLADGSQHHF